MDKIKEIYKLKSKKTIEKTPDHPRIIEKFSDDHVCKKYVSEELPSILPPVRRIVAIGDLHGDWDMTIECLKLARVIDPNNCDNWIGHDTVIVQIGDQIDRCRMKNGKCLNKGETVDDEASDIKILKYFTNLHDQAIKKGGAVYSLLGNHEIMNILGDFRYVSHENLKIFDKDISKAIEKRKEFFKIGNEFSQYLACTRQSVLIIGSNLFVHAGLNGEFAKKGISIEQINDTVREWLLNKIDKKDKLLQMIKNSDVSPFWWRLIGKIDPNKSFDDKVCKSNISKTLEFYNIDKMVIGHTPQSFSGFDGINSTCDNKIWRIDTGSSKAFHAYDEHYVKTTTINPKRSIKVLEILNDKEFNILS
jgi:hypothetical protein